MIKNEVGSVDGLGRESQEQRLSGVRIRCGRGAKFEVEGVEVRVSGSSKEKLLVTGTEVTIGLVIKLEGEEARNGDEEKVIAVEEVIVLEL